MAKITLTLGDEIEYEGEWLIITQINEKQARGVNNKYEAKLIEREVSDHLIFGTRATEPERVVKLSNFLGALTAARAQEVTQPIGSTDKEMESGNSMKSTTTRGRRSASTGTNEPRSKGRLGQLFGHSVVRCIAAAGKAGADYEHTVAALKKHKISAKESTIKQNLRLGKNGTIKGAELTKEQLADFLN